MQLARLTLNGTNVEIWDVAAPPPVPRPLGAAQWGNFRTAELSRIKGLTLFYAWGTLHGVHVDDTADSDARYAFSQLKPWIQASATWVYPPSATTTECLRSACARRARASTSW